MSKPSIVLVPGAWHVPAHFSQVIEKLEDQGYVCVGVNLSTNTRDPLVDGRLLGIEDDVAAIRAAVMSQLDTGHDVVVVTHSYGTVPGTAALTGLSLKARKTAGKSNGSYGVNTSIIPDQVAGIAGIPNAAVKTLRENGVHVFAEVAKSGHSPFLKLPEETAKFIRKAAGEDIETGFS
ncbi:hypothetical protein D6D28_10662 [Aureobasidium pullulans]|uniref:AB hydrolase-1 domain-containing protein n=1 Tax=Aureobasidium pullulans TaxID=5580 RepID=A0A4S8RX33_AURPU|nr:hypothetical protein D6D28_10662 [Aureobasidium pullulans]